MKEQVITYLLQSLSKENKAFKGFPPCPYAQTAYIKQKIHFKELPYCRETIFSYSSEFFRTNSGPLLVYNGKEIDIDTFTALGDNLSRQSQNQGIVFIALHTDETFVVKEYNTRKVPFPILLIQRIEEIEDARENLQNTNYYENWSEDNYAQNEVFNQFTKKLNNKNETS